MSSGARDISGGCLCGSVRYSIALQSGEWPPHVSSCQCTMCRKQTGAIAPHLLTVPRAILELPLHETTTYSHYRSSKTAKRSFCARCGSPLTWESDGMPDLVAIWIGSIDEEYLVGSSASSTEHQMPREGGLGRVLLASCKEHFYLENAVPGITDKPEPGIKHWREEDVAEAEAEA